ncbi:MAG: SRPBCC domain-containing protein [Myxococcota bacterium]
MNDPRDRTIVIERVLDAPRERVFAAWTGPGIERWWGPDGYSTVTSSREVRPGGEWRYVMRHDTHGVFPNRVRYLEITPPERIVYDHDAGEEDTSGPMRVTVTFADRGGRTALTLHTVLATVEAFERARRYNAVEGGNQTIDRLAAELAGQDGGAIGSVK